MLRVALRIGGFVLLTCAFVALVVDGTRSVAGDAWTATPLGATAFWLFPAKFPVLQPAVERHLAGWLWDPVLINLFLLPTWLTLGAVGGAAFTASLRRRPANGGRARRGASSA